MVRPSNQTAYTVSNGTGIIAAPVQEPRDPTTLDVNYTLYQTWQNTATGILFELVSFTSTSGTVLANWVQFATNTNTVQTLTGDTGGAVPPTGSPGNINLLGTAGKITVTGNPATSALTFALDSSFTAIESINVDAFTAPGTDPVIPTVAGQVSVTGSQVAAGVVGTKVIRTDSLAANSLTIEVQRSTATASTTIASNGVSHFNSGQFTVDANGFVSLAGGGEAIDSITPGSGIVVVPDASGNVNFPNGNGIATVGTLNTLTTNMASPFTGDFSFQSVTSGDTETLTVTNTSNTASSQAQINAVVAGTTGGDAWNQWTVGSTRSYSLGTDNSDTRNFKLTYSDTATVNPSTGTEAFFYNPDAIDDIQWRFKLHTMGNITSYVGGAVGFGATNEDSTNLTSAARIVAGTTAGTGGDPYFMCTVTDVSSTVNKFGLDNSDSDVFKFNVGASAGVPNLDGTTVYKIAQATGNIDVVMGDLQVTRSQSPGGPQIGLQNTGVGASSSVRLALDTGSLGGGGDAYSMYNVATGFPWQTGHEKITGQYRIVANTDASQPNMFGTTVFSIDQTGNTNVLAGDLTVTRAAGLPEVFVTQTGTTDFARFRALGTGTKTGFFSSGTSTGPLYWNFGMASILSNAYCLNTSNASVAPEGGTLIWKATTAGEITMPLQPAFSAYNSVARTNQTGDGTAYTVIFNTEEYDQGSNFDGTSTFTASVNGKYHFCTNILLTSLAAGHTSGLVSFNRSDGTIYYGSNYNVGAIRTPANIATLCDSKDILMSAGQTMIVQVTVSGSTKTVGIDASAVITYFTGRLVC